MHLANWIRDINGLGGLLSRDNVLKVRDTDLIDLDAGAMMICANSQCEVDIILVTFSPVTCGDAA